MMSLIQHFDNYILLCINNNMHGYVMDKMMVFITHLGSGGFIWITIAVLLMINKKYRNIGFMVLGALLLNTILCEGILKHLVQRMRPSTYIPAANLLIPKPSSYSFPSGHAASSFAAAGVLAKYFKGYAFVFFGLASLIAFSRLYLNVHYPTDVLAGIILGLICSKIIIYVFNRVNKHAAITMKEEQ